MDENDFSGVKSILGHIEFHKKLTVRGGGGGLNVYIQPECKISVFVTTPLRQTFNNYLIIFISGGVGGPVLKVAAHGAHVRGTKASFGGPKSWWT